MDPSVPRVPKIQSRWSECDNEAERSWKGYVYFSLLIEYVVTYDFFQFLVNAQQKFKRSSKFKDQEDDQERNNVGLSQTSEIELFVQELL